MAEMKTAAYICSGCGIGERVSTAQMAKIAQKEGKMAPVSYTHLRAHETVLDLVCRLLLEKKKTEHLAISILGYNRRDKQKTRHTR